MKLAVALAILTIVGALLVHPAYAEPVAGDMASLGANQQDQNIYNIFDAYDGQIASQGSCRLNSLVATKAGELSSFFTPYWPASNGCTNLPIKEQYFAHGSWYSTSETWFGVQPNSVGATFDSSKRAVMPLFVSEDGYWGNIFPVITSVPWSSFNDFSTQQINVKMIDGSTQTLPAVPVMKFGWCLDWIRVTYKYNTLTPVNNNPQPPSDFSVIAAGEDGGGGVAGSACSNGDHLWDATSAGMLATLSNRFAIFGTAASMSRPFTLPLQRQCQYYAIDITNVENTADWWKTNGPEVISQSGSTFTYQKSDARDSRDKFMLQLTTDSSSHLSQIYIQGNDGSGSQGGNFFTVYCVNPPDPDSGSAYCPATDPSRPDGSTWAWSPANPSPSQACCGDDGSADVDGRFYSDYTCTYDSTTKVYSWKTASQYYCNSDTAQAYVPGGGCCDASKLGKLSTSASDEAVCTLQDQGGSTQYEWINASSALTTTLQPGSDQLLASNSSRWLACGALPTVSEPPHPQVTDTGQACAVFLSCPNNIGTSFCNGTECICVPPQIWDGSHCISNYMPTDTGYACDPSKGSYSNPDCASFDTTSGAATCQVSSTYSTYTCVCPVYYYWNDLAGPVCTHVPDDTGFACGNRADRCSTFGAGVSCNGGGTCSCPAGATWNATTMTCVPYQQCDTGFNYDGTGNCTSAAAAIQASTCNVVNNTNLGWIYAADEGGTLSLATSQEIRYGADAPSTSATQQGYGAGWIIKTLSGTVACSNAVFGDPAPQTPKSCQARDPAAPAYVCLNNWSQYHGTTPYTFDNNTVYINMSTATPAQKNNITQICKDYSLVPANKKYAPDYSDFSFCNSNQCWYADYTGTVHSEDDKCEPEGTYALQDICMDDTANPGSAVWNTRLQTIADTLYNVTGYWSPGNFILHCDNDSQALNSNNLTKGYVKQLANPTPPPAMNAPLINSFCVLSKASGGPAYALGVSMNSYNAVGPTAALQPVQRFVNNAGLPKKNFLDILQGSDIAATNQSCDNVVNMDPSNYNDFQKCDPVANGSLYYHVNQGLLLMSSAGDITTPTLWQYLTRFWNNLVGGGQPDLLISLRGNKIYVAEHNGQSVQGTLQYVQGGQLATVVYQGFNPCMLNQSLSDAPCTAVAGMADTYVIKELNPSQQDWEHLTLTVRP